MQGSRDADLQTFCPAQSLLHRLPNELADALRSMEVETWASQKQRNNPANGAKAALLEIGIHEGCISLVIDAALQGLDAIRQLPYCSHLGPHPRAQKRTPPRAVDAPVATADLNWIMAQQ